jgi:hypothetical protein
MLCPYALFVVRRGLPWQTLARTANGTQISRAYDFWFALLEIFVAHSTISSRKKGDGSHGLALGIARELAV